MGYTNATEVLPKNLLEAVQRYIDGQCVYIPRKDEHKKAWGEQTRTKTEIDSRNRQIRAKYAQGQTVTDLAEMFYLSPKTIYRILGARTSTR